jgi:threonine 3-dehydrogenase
MELAKKLGADMVLNAREEGENIVKIIRDATDGNGVDVVLEMSGAPSAVKQAFKMLTPGGRVSLFGLFDRPVEFDLNNAEVFRAATVYGISGRRMFQTWYQVRGLLSNPMFKDKIGSIITHRIPIKDVAKGMEAIHSKKAGKVVLEPRWE